MVFHPPLNLLLFSHFLSKSRHFSSSKVISFAHPLKALGFSFLSCSVSTVFSLLHSLYCFLFYLPLFSFPLASSIPFSFFYSLLFFLPLLHLLVLFPSYIHQFSLSSFTFTTPIFFLFWIYTVRHSLCPSFFPFSSFKSTIISLLLLNP